MPISLLSVIVIYCILKFSHRRCRFSLLLSPKLSLSPMLYIHNSLCDKLKKYFSTFLNLPFCYSFNKENLVFYKKKIPFGKNIFHYLEHDNEINNHEAKMNKNVLEKC